MVNDSRDRTVVIANSFGEKVKIYEEPWRGFSGQKNSALEKSSNPWVLSLDADEEVDDQLLRSIIEFIEADNPKFSGAYFSRRTFFMGRWIKHGN